MEENLAQVGGGLGGSVGGLRCVDMWIGAIEQL